MSDALRYFHSYTGIERGRSVLIGYSLGGSVALSVAAREPELAGVVVWNGSMPDAYHDVEVLPPLLILHGAHDSIIPSDDARQLAALCAMHGIPYELTLYPNQGHVFDADAITRVNQQIEAFLRRVLPLP